MTDDRRTVLWPGRSGSSYRYWVFPLATNFAAQPANFVFAKEIAPGRWIPVCIGETENLADRSRSREEEDCARRSGADHIHVHRNEGGISQRRREKEDLLARWDTPCSPLPESPA